VRTTLTLEPDVERLLREAARREQKSFKQVVNEAIRRGLASPLPDGQRPRYVVSPHRTRLRAGIDPSELNRLLDDLEIESSVAGFRE
jgi:hypothetical protein